MTYRTINSEIRVPDPTEPTWYWHKQNANAKWEPILVTPKTESWPATVQISGGAKDVDKVPGIWGEMIPYPKEAADARSKII